MVFAAFVLPGYLGGSSPATVAPSLLPVLLTSLPQIALLLYLLGVQGELGRQEFGILVPRARDLVPAVLLLAAMLAALGLVELVLSLLPEGPRSALTAGTRYRLGTLADFPAAALLCLVAASREELIFRSYLFVRLGDLRLPPAAALAGSSALFAAAHAYQGLLAVALAFVQAILLGAAFLRWRRISIPVYAHAAHNLIVLALSLLPAASEAL